MQVSNLRESPISPILTIGLRKNFGRLDLEKILVVWTLKKFWSTGLRKIFCRLDFEKFSAGPAADTPLTRLGVGVVVGG